MSDFISELRREVLQGHSRHRQRSRMHRVIRPLHPRGWRPVAIVAAAAAAAGVFIVAIAARHLIQPTPARPHVIGTLPIGGTPTDAAFADGSLWVGDFRGRVLGVDVRRRRVRVRVSVRVPGQPDLIAADPRSVWVGSPDVTGRPGGPIGSHLTRIDPRTGKPGAPVTVGPVSAIALGPDALWAARRFTAAPERIERLDPSRGTALAGIAVANVDGLAADGRTLWAIVHDGTLVEIDTSNDRIVHQWPQLAPSDASGSSQHALVADADGVWALSTEKAAILRVQAGDVVGKFPISPAAQPLLARTPGGLWITSGNALLSNNRLIRIDPETGKPTGTLELGRQRPIALVAAGATLCVVTSDGTLLLIR